MGDRPAGARAMCVWLGTLASYRPGFINDLVLRYRTTAQVLVQPPGDIAEFARRRSRRRRTEADGATGRDASGAASDAARFAAVLAEGPEACLGRAERRPPGDLVVAWSESLYPDQLRDLGDPPLCLFARGGKDRDTVRARVSAVVDAPLVAVVGTRTPSPYGLDMARCLADGLTRAGVIVVSGLALGIDAAAQKAAVDAEVALSPATVAVLGCGADVVYPRTNAKLYARVAGSGLVLSEFAWGVPARAWRFPARNRVMAALARAVVLVEGAQRSGARITAGYGVDIGREVLCVPGEAGRRLSQAPNRLLGHGAGVCESAADVLRAIGVGGDRSSGDGAGGPAAPLPVYVLDHGGAAIRDVLAALSDASFTIDQLAVRCSLTVAKAASAVSDLEIEGLARRVEGGRYRLLRQ
ncbi:MAG TPA: DNA-processing protein DprA [Thermoleophilia bacterium]|nr:DNA-processing protein DprA [Thermoleophilia bacterium]